MPISAVIHLFPQEDVWLPPTMGNLIHGALLDIFDRMEPEIAERLHAGNGCQPFTISPLQGKFERPGGDRTTSAGSGQVLVREGTECWLRFTLLEDALFEPLSRFFLEGKVPAIRLGKGLFQLMRLATSGSGEDAQWSGYASYEELRERARAGVWIDLRFYSPTAFREQSPRGSQSKRRNCTFPEPIRCFQSWVNRWNAFSPLPIDRERLLTFVNNHARVDHIDSHSQMLDYGRYRQRGFVGSCELHFLEDIEGDDSFLDDDPPDPWGPELGDPLPVYPPPTPGPPDRVRGRLLEEERLREVNLLSDFAFYCGTGYKTTMGMGQTRRQG